MNLTIGQQSKVFEINIDRDINQMGEVIKDIYLKEGSRKESDIANDILNFKKNVIYYVKHTKVKMGGHYKYDDNLDAIIERIFFSIFSRSKYEDWTYATVNIEKLCEKVNYNVKSSFIDQFVAALEAFWMPYFFAHIDQSQKYIHLNYSNRISVCSPKKYDFPSSDLYKPNQYRKCRKYTDINIVIPGDNNSNSSITFPAHKVILASNSKYFEKMFTSGMKESTQSSIELTDLNKEGCEVLLNAIYGDFSAINNTDQEGLKNCLEIAEEYCVPELEKVVMHRLLEQLDSVNSHTENSLKLLKKIYLNAKLRKYSGIQERTLNALVRRLDITSLIQLSLLAEECDIPELQSACLYYKSKLSEKILELLEPAGEGDYCAKHLLFYELYYRERTAALKILRALESEGSVLATADRVALSDLEFRSVEDMKDKMKLNITSIKFYAALDLQRIRHHWINGFGQTPKEIYESIINSPEDPTNEFLSVIGENNSNSPFYNELFNKFKHSYTGCVRRSYEKLAQIEHDRCNFALALKYCHLAKERGSTWVDALEKVLLRIMEID